MHASKTTHHVQSADFKRAQTLAQCGFQSVFPALLDVDAAPQALQTIQPVFGQPGFQLAVNFDFFLQRAQSISFGRQVSPFGRLGVDGQLFGAALFVQLRHTVRQLVQAGLSLKLRFLRGFKLTR